VEEKIVRYNVEPENTYNMDEKGFTIGAVGRTKRVFSKRQYKKKQYRQSLQDGNREWITTLATVCADGTSPPPHLIYEAAGRAIQSNWVEDIDAQEHSVHVSVSPTGYTNNEIGLAWLEQVFERFTKEKARRDYRLLILDGYGSHLTSDFIDFCNGNRILLAIFPPHATHSLQPLNVVLFGPLSKYYSQELDRYLHQSQGLTRVTKRDFFNIFWPAWGSTIKPDTIMKSFQATGVWPMDADAVLQRFNNSTSGQNEALELGHHGDGDSWRELRKIFDSAVADKAKVEARRLEASLHSL
jgi:hypothetical protein